MRVAAKLLVAFLAVTLAVLGLSTYLHVEAESDLFDAETRKDAASVATALASAVELLVARGEADDAAAVVLRADQSSPHLRIRWISCDDCDALAAGPSAGEAVQFVRTDSDGRAALFTYVLIEPDTQGRGRTAIEIEESLASDRAFLKASVDRSVASAAAMFLGAALVTTLFGAVVLARPLRRLRGKARRAGAGDFAEPLVLRQRDELRDLAEDLNSMCDDLARSRQRAESAHAAQIAALEQLRRADRLATVGQLAAGIAHEIGTPLAVVSGRAKMIATGEEIGAEASESARIIAEQAQRIAHIIRQLLDFSRVRKPESGAVDLEALAGGVVVLLEQLAKKRDVTLVVSANPAGAPRAYGDVGQLQQAVANLVVNAIQASPPGGRVELSVVDEERSPPPGSGSSRTDWVRLSVVDHGAGMDAETASHVFEPFYTTKDVGEGTGLGLAVTHGIVAEHGGWIDVESALGEGSTFSIFLPRPSGDSA